MKNFSPASKFIKIYKKLKNKNNKNKLLISQIWTKIAISIIVLIVLIWISSKVISEYKKISQTIDDINQKYKQLQNISNIEKNKLSWKNQKINNSTKKTQTNKATKRISNLRTNKLNEANKTTDNIESLLENENQIINTGQNLWLKYLIKNYENIKNKNIQNLIELYSCQQRNKNLRNILKKLNTISDELIDIFVKQIKYGSELYQTTNDQELQKCLEEIMQSSNIWYINTDQIKNNLTQYQKAINQYLLKAIDQPKYCISQTEYLKDFQNELNWVYQLLSNDKQHNTQLKNFLKNTSKKELKKICKQWGHQAENKENKLQDHLEKLEEMSQNPKEIENQKEWWKEDQTKPPRHRTPYHNDININEIQNTIKEIQKESSSRWEEIHNIKKWWNYIPREYIDKLFKYFDWDDTHFPEVEQKH